MDEQELLRLLQQAQEEIRTLGSVSKETADKIEEAQDEFGKFKKVMKDSAAQFGRTMLGLTKSVGEGNTEFTVFNSTVDTVTSALSEMGKAIPFFGAAMVAAGEGAKFLLGQLQATTKAFNQVSDAGLAGAQGMGGLRDQFTTAGVDLQTFTKVVTGNSQALAAFGGTAADGAQRFSKALGQINRDFGDQLMNMGVSFDALAEQTAAFITQQSRLGRAQTMTQAQITQGTVAYVRELDELAKLTGQQKNEIIKQQDAALSESRFRAKTEELVAQGRVREAKAMLDFQTRVNRFSPALAQGLRDISSGFVNTEAAQAAFIQTGGQAANIMRQLSAGTIDQEQAFAQLSEANRQTLPMQRSLAMAVGDLPGVFVPFAQSADFANAKVAEFGRVAGMQAQQMAGADGLTQSAVAAQRAMMQFSIAVNELGTQALPSAGAAVQSFSDVMTKAVQAISKATGVQVQMPQQQYADGGIARGPESGYAATLHGAEAVVPLPDGNTIPVEIKGMASDQLVKEMAQYLAKANRMYLETIPASRGGTALEDVNTSADYMREVNRLFEMAAVRAAEATERGVDYKQALVMKELLDRASLMKELAQGGITQGPSIAGEAGPEAVVPLPDGRTIPVEIKTDGRDTAPVQTPVEIKTDGRDTAPVQTPVEIKTDDSRLRSAQEKETFFAGMGSHGSVQQGNMYTDRKLTDMIMARLGLDDLESKIAINKSGIGLNYSMFGGAGGMGQGVEMGSAIAGGAMRDDIADAVAQLVEGGQPLQEALKKTAEDFNAAMQEFVKQQAGPNNEGMMNLMMQLIDLQRSQNATSKQILQVSAN